MTSWQKNIPLWVHETGLVSHTLVGQSRAMSDFFRILRIGNDVNCKIFGISDFS